MGLFTNLLKKVKDDTSNLGIVKNTILGIPKAAKDVKSNIFDKIVNKGEEVASNVKTFVQDPKTAIKEDFKKSIFVKAPTTPITQRNETLSMPKKEVPLISEKQLLAKNQQKQFEDVSNLVMGFTTGPLSVESKIAIAASKDAGYIASILKKEIPALAEKDAINMGKILRDIDDPQTVESIFNRIKVKLGEKARGVVPTKSPTVVKPTPSVLPEQITPALQASEKGVIKPPIQYQINGKTFNNVKEATVYKNELDNFNKNNAMFDSSKRIDTTIRGVSSETPQQILAQAEKKAAPLGLSKPKPTTVGGTVISPKNVPQNVPEKTKNKIAEYKEMMKAEREMLENMPEAKLKKYYNYKEGAIPEVGLTKRQQEGRFLKPSAWRERGDEISADLGFEDSEVARAKFEDWKNQMADWKARWKALIEEEKSIKNVPFMPKKQAIKYSAEGIPLALTPREQAIILNKNLQSQQKVLLLDTTTGEGRSLEKLAYQEAGEPILRKKSLADDVSLTEIIAKEPTPVNQKVTLLDYIRTPDRVLKKLGLEKTGNFLRFRHENYLKELPKNIDKITEWSKRVVDKKSNEQIFRWLDGEAMDLRPQDLKVATEIKKWLEQWADRLGLKEADRISYYITHIFDKELLAKEFPEEISKIIDNKIPGEIYDPFLQERLGKLGYKKDTWAALDAYTKRATRKVWMDPALEKLKKDSANLEKSGYDFVKNYVSNINMRPNKLDNLLDNTFKNIIGYKLGQRPTLTLTRFLRQMTYRAMLGLNPASALKNISQGINTYAKLGEKYTAIGYIKLFNKGAKKELIREGVLNSGFIEDRALSATKKTIEKFDKVLFSFFQGAEHINRGAAYFGAKSQFLNGKVPKKEIQRALGFEDIKGEGVNYLTEENAIKYAKHIVRNTQFTFGKIDTPIVLSSDIGKTIGQFQSFTTKQVEFLSEMAKRAVKGDEKARNFIGLLRYAVAGTIFVHTIGKAFNMKEKDLIPFWRFGTPPSLKLPVEIGKAIFNVPNKYGQERDLGQKAKDIGNTLWGIVPAGTQIKKTYQGIEAVKEGKSIDKAGRSQFDVGGTLAKDIQAILFGKYSGKGAKQYFDKEMTYAEQTLDKLRKSPTGKEDLKKIIEENPVLAKNIIKVLKEEASGITDDEKKIKNLGVANKKRAEVIAKKINKLKTKEEKKALIIDYVKKGIITDDVIKQLPEFIKY